MNNIICTINHERVVISAHPGTRLLDVLRNEFHLMGSKEGCGEGECGACAILFNNRLVNSCLVPVATVHNQEILTIEGLNRTPQGQLLQQCFAIEGAVQCGICTPGMMMAAHALLQQNPHPTREQVQIGLSGNLCRCTGYNMIINAVQRASKEGEGLW